MVQLYAYLNKNEKIEMNLIIRILIDIVSGIEYLHSHMPILIIHRDTIEINVPSEAERANDK